MSPARAMLSSVALSKIERFFHASQTLTSFFFKEEDPLRNGEKASVIRC
jgi:hypothetical protein